MTHAREWMLLGAAALACSCEPLPERFPRIVEALPSGVVRADAVRIAFTASEPLEAADATGGARVVLCRAEDLREVKPLAEAGAAAGGTVPSSAVLENGGKTVVVRPEQPLVPGDAYAALFAHGARASDGRVVLDREGRPRSVVVEFTVSPVLSGPVHAELTKVLADAETPEAGGEYVEVTNLAATPLDLAGFKLAKRGPSGAFTRCSVERRAGTSIPPQGRAVISGGGYDGRYALPPTVSVYACGTAAVAGGLANDRAPALLLEDPAGAVVSTFGVAGAAPLCQGAAVVRVDTSGPDAPGNLACADALAPASATPGGPVAP